MKSKFERSTVAVLGLTLLLGAAGCAGMSQRDQNTAVGAGIGAVGGAVLTDGNPIGTIGGAAVGGVIGNQINTGDGHHHRH